MAPDATDPASPEIEWDDLAPGGEVSATVIMASGFVLRPENRVRERYRVVGALGDGSMGQVLAVTLVGSPDHQTYALKVVARPAEPATPEAHDEAERQAKWLAEILRREAHKQDIAQRHGVPVARLFALVRLDDGSIGIRMEVARGRSLEASIEDERPHRAAPPDVARAVLIVRKLVSQLRRLHEMVEPGSPGAFVHSDIKPGNVFVDDRDPTDLAVTLLDFGVATAGQALAHDMSTRAERRRTLVMHEAGGTVGYAPPHHFRSRATPLSDVYAAVVVLYELITLDLPWELEPGDAQAEHIDRVELRMLAGPRPVRAVRPAIPERDAAVLDAFFRREFGALNELAAVAARALEQRDERLRQATTARLTQLAREYQGRLDELADHFITRPSRPPTLPLSAPPPAPVPSMAPATPPGAPAAEPSGQAVAASPPETSLALPLTRLAAAARADATPAPTPAIRHPSVRRLADVTSAMPLVRKIVKRHDGRDRRVLGLALGVAIPLAIATGYLWSRTRAGAPDAPAAVAPRAQPCTCAAAAPGTRVVARGGALGRDEVVLCVATTRTGERAVEYVGSGTIPPEVFDARPAFGCRAARGDAPLALTVEHYGRADAAAEFRCLRDPAARAR